MKLDDPGVNRLIAKAILSDIDDLAVKLYDDGHRTHLGASLMGRQCYRQLWYTFRWCFHKVHSGRMLRLFNRGHREEERFNAWLTELGFKFVPPPNGKQWQITGVMGHYGGSCDNIGYLPARYQVETELPLLFEMKTNSTGAGFVKILDSGCSVGKPEHFDQQCQYGYNLGLTHSAYLNVCKNDDNLHVEIIKLDLKRGADLAKKAEVVIMAQEPPKRISESKAYGDCQMCDFRGICHEGIPIQKNCRSCKKAQPIENKQWACNHWRQVIPSDVIPKGCEQWEPIA